MVARYSMDTINVLHNHAYSHSIPVTRQSAVAIHSEISKLRLDICRIALHAAPRNHSGYKSGVVSTSYGHRSPLAGAQHRPQRSAPTGKEVNDTSMNFSPHIEVLRGRDGRDGRDGIPGPRGPQGQRGEMGPQGPVGGRGEKGEQGANGPQGKTGRKGEQGVAGPPGPRNGGVVYTRWGKTAAQISQELSWCIEEGLEEAGLPTLEEVQTTSACPMIQTTLHTNLECKDGVMCMELNINHMQDHSKLFTTTMSPVLCVMLQRGWQSQ